MFDLPKYVRQSTKESAVPEKVKDRDMLYSAARLVGPKLPKRSGLKKGRT
jgi:hypothetical protein